MIYNIGMLSRHLSYGLAVIICLAVGLLSAPLAAAHAGNAVEINGRTYALDEGFVQPDGRGSLGTYYCYREGAVVHSHDPDDAGRDTAFRSYEDADAQRLCGTFMRRVNILGWGYVDVWLGESIGFSVAGLVRSILVLAVAWFAIVAMVAALKGVIARVVGDGRGGGGHYRHSSPSDRFAQKMGFDDAAHMHSSRNLSGAMRAAGYGRESVGFGKMDAVARHSDEVGALRRMGEGGGDQYITGWRRR